MASQKPSIPKGTRDFTPQEMVRRNYIFDVIRNIFQTFGYQPIETPAMENLSTLTGKYGLEGDKLLFRILNSGNFLEEIQKRNYESGIPDYKELTPFIAEKGLRYDLTVPFARFVVQHQNEITFPFKRYQMQPVWRADRPQKGRYREFFQCDVDVIGSNSLLCEVELIQIIDEIFSRLGINVLIRINNRKVLAGVSEAIGEASRLTEITIAMDKLDKIGIENVNEELLQKGISAEGIERLRPLLLLEGRLKEKVMFLTELLGSSETGRKGIEELLLVKNHLKDLGLKNKFDLDVKLARGLNYYTGTIIEVKALDVPIGSVCGGGRYDDLTGIFGLSGVSGVGISFGADRIYDVMNELKLFPENLESTSKLLFLNFGKEEEKLCLQLLARCRKAGIASEIYPENTKLKKQLDYANRKNIPFVVFIGKDEMKSGMLTLKNMVTGDQESFEIAGFVEKMDRNQKMEDAG
jgi:histidyl-tRNA synthetase